jgi:hypothetical protein
MTRFTLFHGVSFADEAGLVGVGEAPCFADRVATLTTNIVAGSELGIKVLHLFANTTKFHYLAYVYFASIVVVGRHRINICQGFF